ncbi:helix-turn-helix transcriptional regulator [Streptomyces sp. RFCAC02]|uniref:helix-turn-helix domain-containing protein n=1 Tax=Streptomyces sp. RFCAC02 TaxID=2499143 RepID=UPI0010215283|nr:helix-turn-helix transcriptional regulator [Streptomyces sp. RFCAC02]
MDGNDVSGRRVRRARLDRDWTQERLAERAGVHVNVVKKIEAGGAARIDTYHALARALGLRTSQLFETPGMGADTHADDRAMALLELRRAIAPPIGLDGRVPVDEAGPVDLVSLRRTADTLVGAYYRDDYRELGRLLPPVVMAARQAVEDLGAEAAALRADVLLMAGRYLTQVRAYDLAHTALREAMEEAARAGDRTRAAGGVCLQGWMLLRQGRLDETERLAVDTADQVEPRLSRASRAELGVWGRLLMRGSAAAARNNRPQEARSLLRAARTAAMALGGRSANDPYSWGRFDLPGVVMQGIENHAVGGHPARVVGLARRIPPRLLAGLTPNTRNRHVLDVANAHARLRQPDDALRLMAGLRETTPDWLRHQGLARDTFRCARESRRRPLTSTHRELGEFLGLP